MKQTLLFICLCILSLTVYGRPVIPVENYPDDFNPYEQNGSVTCALMDEVPTAEKACCEGFEKGFNGKCLEPTVQDPGLTPCTSSASCSNGTACMPASGKDMFSPTSLSWDRPEFADLKSTLKMQLVDNEDMKRTGESCDHARECPSYSCVAGKCVERKVCRYARLKEAPVPGQKCGAGYVLTNGICDLDPKKKYPVYNDLVESFEYTQAGNQCSSFKIKDNDKKRGTEAIKYLRALEWLVMSHTVDPYNDCYNLTSAMKDDIMKAFHEGRKAATEELAKNLKEIENDSQLLANAKSYGDQTVVIHGNESLTGNQLDTRLASGRDVMYLMMRRNSFFIQYEAKMFQLLEEAIGKFHKMGDALSGWGNDDNVWNLGTRTSHFKECSARRKIYKPFKWRWKDYHGTGDRWGFAYTLDPTRPEVKQVFEKESILKVLTKIMNFKDEGEVKTQFYRAPLNIMGQRINKMFLVDPFMHGGTLIQNYGQHTSDGHNGFFGLGPRDRHPYAHNPDLLKINSDRKQNFLDHIKGFGLSDGVNHEFELIPYMDDECLAKEKVKKGSCERFAEHEVEFSKLVNDVMDISMAQFLAYSLRLQKDNFDYFGDPSSGRSRFFISALENLGNVGEYYLTSMEMQKKQNECLDKAINGIYDSGIYQPGGGIEEGDYYDPNLSNPGAIEIGTKPTTVKPSKGTQLASGNISGGIPKSIISGSTSTLGSTGNVGSGNSSFGKGSSLSEQTIASFANRKKDLLAKNATAASKGLKVKNPKKDYAETVASMKEGDALAGAGKGGNPSNGATSVYGKNSSMTGSGVVDEMNGSENAGNEDNSMGDIASPLGGAGFGINTGTGLGQNYGSGSSSDSSSGLTDQTGLSEEEKNQMMAVYERTKHRYNSDGEDGIFEKVSKAYVRNLEKILVRKKSID